jgi:hypothetical protein
MNPNDKKLLMTTKEVIMRQPTIITLVLFLAIFVGCIGTVFMPFTIVNDDSSTILGAQSNEGLMLMSKSWIKNPNYFFNIGFVAFISLIGAGWSFYNLKVETKQDEKADTEGRQVT